MNQKGFASIVLVVIIIILAGAAGYFAVVRKYCEEIAPPKMGSRGQSVIEKDGRIYLCRTFFEKLSFHQTSPGITVKQTPSAFPDETLSWNSYTYPSAESGVLPHISFRYSPVFGSGPTLISSRKTNRPQNISSDWGGFVEFNPTGALSKRGLRLEFFERVNPDKNFESYVTKMAASGGWEEPKYFQGGIYRMARIRFASPSYYDADVSWYFVELTNEVILAVSTSGDKDFLYDDDQVGNSTRDKIISTLSVYQ